MIIRFNRKKCHHGYCPITWGDEGCHFDRVGMIRWRSGCRQSDLSFSSECPGFSLFKINRSRVFHCYLYQANISHRLIQRIKTPSIRSENSEGLSSRQCWSQILSYHIQILAAVSAFAAIIIVLSRCMIVYDQRMVFLFEFRHFWIIWWYHLHKKMRTQNYSSPKKFWGKHMCLCCHDCICWGAGAVRCKVIFRNSYEQYKVRPLIHCIRMPHLIGWLWNMVKLPFINRK